MRHRETFRGIYAGLVLVSVSAVFFFLLHVGGDVYREQTVKQSRLSEWSLARMLNELGEYDQKIPDCAGLVQGMTGYAYVKVSTITGQLKGVVLICK